MSFLLGGTAWAQMPSPGDWRDLVIYQVITDRFSDGIPSNNAVEGNYAPADGAKIHGGDFAGLESKLDYLVHLGVNAIWISPVVLNANAEYHGYAARDFFSIAPHFGPLSDLQSLTQAAHARGIYVIVDVVVNHMGDLVYSTMSPYPAYRYPATYTLSWRDTSKRYVGVLNDLTKFHAHGNIGNFTDPEQIVGELFGLDDLKTEDPAVQTLLVQAAEWMISNTDCDGFRLDTVKHVDNGFWDVWSPAVHAYASTLGKNSFFMFGEVFEGDDVKNGSYTGTQGGGNYRLDSVLYYPMYFTAEGVFLYDSPPSDISSRYGALTSYDPTSRERLVTFLDNHDNSRFLRAGPGATIQDESRLRTALGWLLTSRGVPCIYYGTEQEFDGGGDPYCREDMWNGQWDFGPSDGDNFDLTHPLFRYVRRLNEARQRHEALRRGATTELFAESAGPGLYIYQRTTATDTALVALNTSNGPLTRVQTTPWVSGTVLADALEPALRDTTTAGGAITLRVPARGVRVLESSASHPVAAPKLTVESMFPGHDQSLNDRDFQLTLNFDRKVDPATLTAAFHISPSITGGWAVSGNVARFHPTTAWSATTYTWYLDTTVRGIDGSSLAARFDARFSTTAYATGVVVPAGYAVDRIYRPDWHAPEGLLPAPWLGPDAMLLSDTGLDRVLTLTPGGDAGAWLGDSRWSSPEGLSASPTGSVAIADPGGVYEADSRRMTSQRIGGSVATQTGAVAWSGPDFSNRIYLCDPSGDRVAYISPISTLATFATGIKGGEGLAFGPGGAWGTDLYVSDANLTSLGTTADGLGRVVKLTSAGAVSTLVQDASLLNGATALAFDAAGRFGGNLFVADILGDRIIQVTPAGAASVFASGFKNLASSHCLAFGADGALYVADPGSGQSFSNTHGANPAQIWRISRQDLVLDVPRAGSARVAFAPPAPNPADGSVALTFNLAASGWTRLAIYDVAGRVVRELARGRMAAGEHRAVWDLAQASGRRTPAGIYFARLETSGRMVTHRVVVID